MTFLAPTSRNAIARIKSYYLFTSISNLNSSWQVTLNHCWCITVSATFTYTYLTIINHELLDVFVCHYDSNTIYRGLFGILYSWQLSRPQNLSTFHHKGIFHSAHMSHVTFSTYFLKTLHLYHMSLKKKIVMVKRFIPHLDQRKGSFIAPVPCWEWAWLVRCCV